MIDTPVKPKAADPTGPRADPAARAWRIIGGSITAAVLLCTLAVFCVAIWSSAAPERSFNGSNEYARTVASAEVHVDVGAILIGAADGSALVSEFDAVWRGTEPDYGEEWDGDEFTATARCTDRITFGIDLNDCTMDYAIDLPAGADAVADLDVGSVRLDGLDGAVSAEVGEGDVEGVTLRSTGTDVNTDVGNVHLDFAQVLGDITVSVGAGDVVIVVPDDGTAFDVRYDSAVGQEADLSIDTDPASLADYVIDVTEGSGELTVSYAT